MTTLGKYELLEPLGSGATADVYRARDTQLGRIVAIKVLKPSLVADASAFQRFIQEAQAAASLFHPHIATVLDMGEAGGRYFITMRYLPGQSLDKILKEKGVLSWEEVLRLAQQIGSALDYAHQQGFLHRDVKPSNIIRMDDGTFVLTDFGLTRAMMSTGLTSHTGAVLGTPSYIAPEVWLGEQAVPATDQYALACVVVEALTGNTLFTGETPPAIMTSHVLKGANPNFLPKQHAGMDLALTKALDKDPKARYETLAQFAGALQGISQPSQSASPEASQVYLPEPSGERKPDDRMPAVETQVKRQVEPGPLADADTIAPQEAELRAQLVKSRPVQPVVTLPTQPSGVGVAREKAGKPGKNKLLIGLAVGGFGLLCLAAVVAGIIFLPKLMTAKPAPTSTRVPTRTPAPTNTPSPAELLISHWRCEGADVEFTRDGKLKLSQNGSSENLTFTIVDNYTLRLPVSQPVTVSPDGTPGPTPEPIWELFEYKIEGDTLTLNSSSDVNITLVCTRIKPGEEMNQNNPVPVATQPPEATAAADGSNCARADVFCVGLVSDVGKIDDRSFNQMGWEAVLQAQRELGAYVQYIETTDDKDYEKNIAVFADAQYDVIVTVGFSLADATIQAARIYPNIVFIGVDQYQNDIIPNLAGLSFTEDQAGFLAGALAAQMSRSGKIGAICGTDAVPPVWRYCEGYRAGAAYINPNMEVMVVYHNDVGFDKTFTDPEWGKVTALSLIDQGVDVIFGAGGNTGNGALIGAAERNVYVIGVDTDQYYTLPEARQVMLSSATKDITYWTYALIKNAKENSFTGGNVIGGVTLAPYHDLDSQIPAQVKTRMEEIWRGLLDGSIHTQVPVAKP
jgi:basic membrane protein A and related proteins